MLKTSKYFVFLGLFETVLNFQQKFMSILKSFKNSKSRPSRHLWLCSFSNDMCLQLRNPFSICQNWWMKLFEVGVLFVKLICIKIHDENEGFLILYNMESSRKFCFDSFRNCIDLNTIYFVRNFFQLLLDDKDPRYCHI